MRVGLPARGNAVLPETDIPEPSSWNSPSTTARAASSRLMVVTILATHRVSRTASSILGDNGLSSAFPRGRRIRAPTNRAVCRSTVSVQVPGRLSVCHDPSEQTVSMCRRGATRAKDREGDDAMSSPSPLSSRRTDEHRPKNSVALDGVADAFGMRAGRSATKNGSLCRSNFDTGSSWVRIAAVVLPQCPCRRELRGGCKRAIGPIAT